MKTLRPLFFAAACAAFAVACGGSQDTGTAESMPTVVDEVVEAVPTATVRLVHASPASPIRVTAGDMAATAEPLSSGTWTTRMDVPAGEHTLTFSPSGGGAAFATADVDLDADGNYTVFFVGDNTSAIRAEMPRAIVATDDMAAPTSGRARVRFVHAAVGGPAATFSDGSGRGYAAGLAYGAVSSWYDVAGDARTVEIAADGATLATLQAPVTGGMNLTVVVVNEGDGLGALFINETGN